MATPSSAPAKPAPTPAPGPKPVRSFGITLKDPSQASMLVTAKQNKDGSVTTRIKHKAKIDGVRKVKRGATERFVDAADGTKAMDLAKKRVDEIVAQLVTKGWTRGMRAVVSKADEFTLDSLPAANMTPAAPKPPVAPAAKDAKPKGK